MTHNSLPGCFPVVRVTGLLVCGACQCLQVLVLVVLLFTPATSIAEQPCAPFEGGRVDARHLQMMREAAMTGRLYRVDPARSKAGFCVRHFPFQEFRGEFTSLVGGLAFPPDHARAGQALLLIKTTAMQSDDNDLLPMVEGQDFMDTGRFPDILFVGRSVELFSEERGRVRGELTLHGITQPVVFDIDLYVLEGGGGRLPDRILLKGKSEVNRMSFDINSYRYFVSETVRLCLSVELVPFDH